MQYKPPPQLAEPLTVFWLIVQFVSLGPERAQYIPPPLEVALFSLIAQSISLGTEEEQYTPPPLEAVFPLITQFTSIQFVGARVW